MTNRSGVLISVFLAALLSACSAQSETDRPHTGTDTIAGVASVVDGDTIEIRGQRIRLTCSVGGIDLGDHMVQEGWGRDWPQYSQGRYAKEEADARAARAGIWSLECPDDLWGERTYD